MFKQSRAEYQPPAASRRHLPPFSRIWPPLLLTAALAWLILPDPAPAQAPPPQVVILNSYHQGEVWSDDELQGVMSGLRRVYPDLAPVVENLDANRFSGTVNRELMRRYLGEKYRGRKVDLLLALDNPALDLLLDHRDELFASVPVVFAGINGYKPAMIEGRGDITGIAEETDLIGTIRLGLALRPNTREILAVSDHTSTGQAMRRELEDAAAVFEDRLRFTFTPPEPFAVLDKRLRALPQDSLVLILSYVTDASGRTFSRAESSRLISQASPAPVLSINATRLGHGILGGVLITGQEHGRRAAEIALRVLAGEKASSIPVDTTGGSRPMFDYHVLERFQIPESALPPDSVVVNRPVSFYGKHPLLVNSALAVGAFMILLIGLLGAALVRGRRAEGELRARELNYRTIFEAVSDSIIVHDIATGEILDANRKAAASYGLGSLEELKRNDFWHDQPYSFVEAKAWMDKAAQAPQVFEWLGRRRDGRLFWEEVKLQKATLNGRDCLIAVSRDITERKQDQEELQRSEQRYRGLFNSVSDLVFSQDMEGRFLAVNAAARDILGYDPPELLGRKASELMRPALARLFQAEYLDLLSRQGYAQGVSAYSHKSGGHRYLEYRSQLVRPPQGEPFISGVARDVSERLVQQRQLKQLEDQLRQAQKMEAIGTLAGGIAHDFNNILGAVLGFAELALDSAEAGQHPSEEIRQIIAAADRARKLVQQLLTFSRKLEYAPRPLDLNREVESATVILSRTIPKMVAIETKLAPELWLVSADPTQIEQVILNLATNAVDAMPEGGVFTLATANLEVDQDGLSQHHQLPPGRWVLLTASDTGQGMDQQTLEHIFDPFFTTKEIGKGTGLGLASIYGIVKGHLGHIFCFSRPGQGTSFQIYLPALAEHDQPWEGPPDRERDRPPGGSESILLVDDEDALRQMSSRSLEAAGYEVATAGSGEQALEMISREAPDLVVLDLGMPGMGGLKCLERIVALSGRTKVIIASGYADDGQVGAAMRAGAAAFVAKPYHRLDLLRIVREVLDS